MADGESLTGGFGLRAGRGGEGFRGPPYPPCYMGKSTGFVLGDGSGFSHFFRVVSSDYGKPRILR